MRFEFSVWLLILLTSFGVVTAAAPDAGGGVVGPCCRGWTRRR